MNESMMMLHAAIHDGQPSISFSQPRPIRSTDTLLSFDSSASEESDGEDHYGFRPKQDKTD